MSFHVSRPLRFLSMLFRECDISSPLRKGRIVSILDVILVAIVSVSSQGSMIMTIL